MKTPSLSKHLKKKKFPLLDKKEYDIQLDALQLEMLRIQQGIWHQKRRAVIAIEGFDAAGKGGAIRRMIKLLDPRGYQVHPIGPPLADDQGKHYLYRFWKNLPAPGAIAIFDRTWYGRVIVERVDKLIPKKRWKEAYAELLDFEKLLTADGIDIVKIFVAISKDEQLTRFEDRLNDPYKQWKLTDADIKTRARWDQHVLAVDEMFAKTHTKKHPWHLVAGDDKNFARVRVLENVVSSLSHHEKWINRQESTMANIMKGLTSKADKELLRKLGLKKSKRQLAK